MMNDKPLEELNEEIVKLSEEYARLKNKSKPFETGEEKDAREIQFENDKHEKYREFRSFGDDFEKKSEYVLKLGKEVEALKERERKDELEQKLKDQTITEKELLELVVLNNILRK